MSPVTQLLKARQSGEVTHQFLETPHEEIFQDSRGYFQATKSTTYTANYAPISFATVCNATASLTTFRRRNAAVRLMATTP